MIFGDKKIDRVFSALSQDNIDIAIGILVPIVRNDKEKFHQIIIISAENNRIENALQAGMISRLDANTEKNAIIRRLLVSAENLGDVN